MECGLFLKPHELIHSKHDGLWYRVTIRIVEVQDWNVSNDSSDDDTLPDNYDSTEDEDYPVFTQQSRKHLWPKRMRFIDETGSSGGGPVLGPGWGLPFSRAVIVARESLNHLAWSLPSPLCFGRWAHKVVGKGPTPPPPTETGLATAKIVGGKADDAQATAINLPILGDSAYTRTVDPMITEVDLQLWKGAQNRNEDIILLKPQEQDWALHEWPMVEQDPMRQEVELVFLHTAARPDHLCQPQIAKTAGRQQRQQLVLDSRSPMNENVQDERPELQASPLEYAPNPLLWSPTHKPPRPLTLIRQ